MGGLISLLEATNMPPVLRASVSIMWRRTSARTCLGVPRSIRSTPSTPPAHTIRGHVFFKSTTSIPTAGSRQ